MGTRSHHHVTELATSPELLSLQGIARGCVDLLLRGTQEGSLTRHDVAWQRHPFSTPFVLASQPLDEAQSLLCLPSMPRVHRAERAQPGAL